MTEPKQDKVHKRILSTKNHEIKRYVELTIKRHMEMIDLINSIDPDTNEEEEVYWQGAIKALEQFALYFQIMDEDELPHNKRKRGRKRANNTSTNL